MNKYEIAQYLDSTILKDDATEQDIINLCQDAIKYDIKAVCINPYYLTIAKKQLENSNVQLCTVIGFPLGMNTIQTKVFEATQAIELGADEIDMVINVANLKMLDQEKCLEEINVIKQACGRKILKVIVETSQLNQKQKEFAANIICQSNADFIKTSTGFIGNGAQLDDVKTWKKIIGNKKMIKASGGIRNAKDCLQFISSGADRIGTSNAVKIIEELD